MALPAIRGWRVRGLCLVLVTHQLEISLDVGNHFRHGDRCSMGNSIDPRLDPLLTKSRTESTQDLPVWAGNGDASVIGSGFDDIILGRFRIGPRHGGQRR